jgi:AraC family L-rhamnose operon transcriptional activator RhaR
MTADDVTARSWPRSSQRLSPPGPVLHPSTQARSVHIFSEHSVLHKREVVASAELWRHDDPQPAHAHEFMEIVLVKSGTAVHRMRSGSCQIIAGSVLVIRPGQWHAYDELTDFQIWNLYRPYKTIAGELAALRSHPVLAALTSARVTTAGVLAVSATSFGADDGGASAPPSEARWVDVAAIEPYLIELTQPSLGTDRSLTRLGLMLIVLDKLAPAFMFVRPGQTVATTHAAVSAATELLDTTPEYPWTLAELAERVHASASYLCRLFARELGISPLHYLERHRLERTAQLLLEGNLSIRQISWSAGWSDSNYMTRRFRAAYGMSPTKYRAVFQRRPH